jgi:hypothetical protein
MASTADGVKGKYVILSISTNLVTPAYKDVVCSIDNGITGSRNVTTTETKCGTSKAGGSPSYTVTGSLSANSAPGVSEISADDLQILFDSGAEFLWKMAHLTTPGDYYRSGQGFFSSYNETANNGDDVKADFVIEVTSAVDVTP